MICRCEEITVEPIQCPEHFRLYKGGKRLMSVGSIIRASFPMDPSIPEATLENARERGEQVDWLFSRYALGSLEAIPSQINGSGTRSDARDLFLKLRAWFDRQHFTQVEAQIVLGDGDHGGVLDFIFDGIPTELKATYNIEYTHRLQAAAYSRLNGHPAQLLHVTERYALPIIAKLEASDYQDWDLLLTHRRLQVQRKSVAVRQ